MVFGIAAVTLVAWIVIELLSAIFFSSGRKTAAGTTSLIQITAAVIALVGSKLSKLSRLTSQVASC